MKKYSEIKKSFLETDIEVFAGMSAPFLEGVYNEVSFVAGYLRAFHAGLTIDSYLVLINFDEEINYETEIEIWRAKYEEVFPLFKDVMPKAQASLFCVDYKMETCEECSVMHECLSDASGDEGYDFNQDEIMS
ncbi:MAG: hypothetical protein LBL47_03855 [Lactobacillus sp.]|jgi:hypothetical protein|nr:hypothetical protein [Lactobacillus sp.]